MCFGCDSLHGFVVLDDTVVQSWGEGMKEGGDVPVVRGEFVSGVAPKDRTKRARG